MQTGGYDAMLHFCISTAVHNYAPARYSCYMIQLIGTLAAQKRFFGRGDLCHVN